MKLLPAIKDRDIRVGPVRLVLENSSCHNHAQARITLFGRLDLVAILWDDAE